MHIVLAEDCSVWRPRYISYLEQAGHQVTSCVDGRGVLTHFANKGASVDAVITDMQMPHADGFFVLQAVAEYGRIPTLLHSSAGSTTISDGGRNHNFDLTNISSFFPFVTFHLKGTDMQYLRDFVDSIEPS